MARTPKGKAAGTRQALVQYDQALPEIPGRKSYLPPTSHLEKDGRGGYRIVPGRRQSKLLLVSKLRATVDDWRNDHYEGASDTTKRLLEFWFDSDHRLRTGENFHYYFGQREAIETVIYLHEVMGIRDTADLILDYMDDEAYGNDLFVKRKQIIEDVRGKRRLQRIVPDTGQVADQALPPPKLVRYGIKAATGSGKTVVMALAIAWSYFHRRFEADSDLARHFLILAPNVIVYERLKLDFENEQIFRDLPIIPPEWRHDWDLRTVLRGESYSGTAWATLYLTNIQQLHDRGEEEPINPIERVLGPRVKGDGQAKSASIIEMVHRHDDLLIINDEAHHVHDEDLVWWQIIEELHEHRMRKNGTGLVAQLDFSATPRDRNGTYFPWVVSDYPLAQAVEDGIVKAPLVVHETDANDPKKYTNAAVAYKQWIQIALSRWREHRDCFEKLDIKPVLFVMAETTKDADVIAEAIRRETDIKPQEVLTIHVNERGQGKGEVAARDLDAARAAARSIDKPGNKIKVVVSVLMLREGWDVRNVSVILGLRPFTAKANILPEQGVGRGLRLIRGLPSEYAQVVEIVGTPKFEQFVKELEVEGVGVGFTRTPPKPGEHIYPMKNRLEHDIHIPQLSQSYSRNYKDIHSFDVNTLPSDLVALEASDGMMTVDIVHGLTEVKVSEKTVTFDPDTVFLQDVLAHATQGVLRTAKLGCPFRDVYPIVQRYVAERFFDRPVDLDDPTVARALVRPGVHEKLVAVVAEELGKHATETKVVQLQPEPLRLSETRAFIWRRETIDARKTIFNRVACFNKYEAEFAQFLDRAPDVVSFAKLAEFFTGFGLEYLSERGSLRIYYPDFVAKVNEGGKETLWILETKGREDWDTEVPRKDAHAEWWCEQVSAQTGETWSYAKLPYKTFHGNWPSSFDALNNQLKPALNLRLVFEPAMIKEQ